MREREREREQERVRNHIRRSSVGVKTKTLIICIREINIRRWAEMLKTYEHLCLIWFLCLMAYQPLWVIKCQTILVGQLWIDNGVHTIPKGIRLKVKFKLTFYVVLVKRICHHNIMTPSTPLKVFVLRNKWKSECKRNGFIKRK